METQERTELISVREAAKIANVSYQTVWRAIYRGELEGYRVGVWSGPIRIPRAEFEHRLFGEPGEAA